jgi:AcrR family transcriptional regulator
MKRAFHHGNLRQELLEQAQAELEENGIEALSLRQVAKRAGVSHTAFAHHFGDARGLLTALTTQGFDALGRELAAAQAAAARPKLDPVVAASLAYVEFAQARPQLFTLMFASRLPDFADMALDASSMAAFSVFIDVIQSARKRSAHRSGGVNVPAMAAWSRVHGLALLLLTGRMRSVLSLDPDQRRKAIVKILAAS